MRRFMSIPDTLVFQRIKDDACVMVAVNRGNSKDVTVSPGCSLAAGRYRGLLAGVNSANAGNYAKVTAKSTTLHLGCLSSLVLSSQQMK
jgi:hypothetical protein